MTESMTGTRSDALSGRTPHEFSLERTVVIHAPREAVFRYFTDSARWAAWWGAGSTIDARPGGRMYIRHPNAIEAGGEVLEVREPERIVMTYGFASGTPIPIGASHLTITLETVRAGTRLHLLHTFSDRASRDEHVQGWRYQLSVFANVVANELFADTSAIIDAWFDVWADTDAASRRATLERIAIESVRYRDGFSTLAGIDDVVAHIGATHRFMPGMRLERRGGLRHCQGTVLADWTARSADGAERMRGSTVFVFGPSGKLEEATGLVERPA